MILWVEYISIASCCNPSVAQGKIYGLPLCSGLRLFMIKILAPQVSQELQRG